MYKPLKTTLMLQAIFAFVLISIIILPIPLLIVAERRQKQKAARKLLDEFHAAGSRHKLNFSDQEGLRNAVLGIDGIQRKLLVVERQDDDRFRSVLVNLEDITSVVVQKKLHRISRGDAGKAEQVLETISLVCAAPPLVLSEVVFYNYLEDQQHRAAEMELKAQHWKTLLTALQMPQQQKAVAPTGMPVSK